MTDFIPPTLLDQQQLPNVDARYLARLRLAIVALNAELTALAAGGGGTVTSVDLGATTGLTPSGGPITGAGSLAYTLSTNLQAWHGLATSAKQDASANLTAWSALATTAKADLVGGKVPSSQLPSVAIGTTTPVGSQAAMLALAADIGDIAIRTDLGSRKFLLLGNPATLGDWVAMDASGLPVDSVNGQEGVVVLAKGDIGLGSVDNTADSVKPVSSAQAAADAAVQAFAIQRANHTGSQVMATISDLPVLASGTYTPTLFNTTNVAASTAFACHWLRVGDVVTVSGQVNIDPTAASAVSVLGMSLPVPSNLGATQNLGGVAAAAGTATAVASLNSAILADATNDRAQFLWVQNADIANRTWSFTFSYRVI